ncbi:hypothetical protein ACIQ6K_32410 [Streptomyces sp. NPDC096354]|uniref:hypothetical protein n=1 Tax=Streptomyces sp. NPDC096354 TaxID=3366088 RepID=UPI00381377D2
MLRGETYRQLGEAAWSWVLDQVREDEGPWLPETVPGEGQKTEPAKDRDSLYSGIAGLAPVLAEIAQYRELSDRERALAEGIVTRLSAETEVAGIPVGELRRRCLTSLLTSGVPERLRPGFWDNDGRCCGTAGVGDVLLDAAQGCADPEWSETLLQGARKMGDALVERVIRDESGARWRFLEHRDNEPLLPPGTAWMQGAAGIAAYLQRLARVVDTGPKAPVVDRPDQWWGVPADVRVTDS